MDPDFKSILDKANDPAYLRKFIADADTATTAHMNQSRVASEIFSVLTMQQSIASLERTVANASNTLVAALGKHAAALNESARVASEHARGLKVATWVLVLATIGLMLVTGVTQLPELLKMIFG